MIGLNQVRQRLGQREIWLLKIDAEGAEGDIFEGAPEAMLGATQNAIVEWRDNICPGVASRCREVLRSAGFSCRERIHPWNEGVIYATRS